MTSELKSYPSSISGICGKMELMPSVDLPSSLEQKCYNLIKLTRSNPSALQIDVFVEQCAIELNPEEEVPTKSRILRGGELCVPSANEGM